MPTKGVLKADETDAGRQDYAAEVLVNGLIWYRYTAAATVHPLLHFSLKFACH